jgi:hypothetical protein
MKSKLHFLLFAVTGSLLFPAVGFGTDCSSFLGDVLRAIPLTDWDEMDPSERYLAYQELRLEDFKREVEDRLPQLLKFQARTAGQAILLSESSDLHTSQMLSMEHGHIVVGGLLAIKRRASPFAKVIRNFSQKNKIASMLYRFKPRHPDFTQSPNSMFAWQFYSFKDESWSHLSMDIEDDGYTLSKGPVPFSANPNYMILSWSTYRRPGPWSE